MKNLSKFFSIGMGKANSNPIRKIAIALLLMLAPLTFSLNVSYVVKEGEIVFAIDGTHYEKTNLTLFLLKDEVQIMGWQKNEVVLPYYHFVPYNESGVYELRAISNKREYTFARVNISAEEQETAAEQEKEDKGGTEFAIVLAILGLIVTAYLFVSFIKGKSYSK